MKSRTSLLLVAAFAVACKSAPGPVAVAAPAPAPTPAASAAAAPPAEAPGATSLTPVATVEGVTEYRLDNGLRILLSPDDSKPKFTVDVVYLVGSRHEGYGETGMAHLLEHMLFKGTTRFESYDKVMEPLGASYNASTSYDRTEYHETLSYSDENLRTALELEADRMVNAKISAEDLAKEFTVVRNEFEMRENDPTNVLYERILSTAYLWHNYGKSTIGSRADIERVPADKLRAFYKKYYRPDNAVLLLTGKFEREKALGLIQKYFGPLEKPATPLSPTYTVEPVQDGERTVTLRRVGDVQVVGIIWHTVAASDERDVALSALAFLLTDKPTGRLYKALVEKGLASSVDADASGMYDPGYFEVIAEVPVGKPIEPVREKIIQVVEGLARSKPTDAEIDRFRASAAKQYELAVASTEILTRGLTNATANGDWRLFFLQRDRAEKVTATAAAAAAGEFFKSSNRTVGTFLPDKAPARAPLIERPDTDALVKDYKGRSATDAGEEFDATIANIEKRTTRKQLPFGTKVAYLPKQTRGNVLLLSLNLHFGTEKELTGHDVAASTVGQALLRGSRKHTFEQLKSEMDRLKMQLRVSSDAGNVTVQLKTTRPNLAEAIALVSEILREPVFPVDQLEVMRKEALTALEASLQDPGTQAQIALERKLSPWPKGDLRYVPTTRESIELVKAATLDEVKKVHKMWGISHSELAVVGDFDPAEVDAAITKGLGDWKSPGAYKRVDEPYKAVAASAEVIDTPDKENALIMAGRTIAMRDDAPDYPALFMAGFILGNGFQGRLMTRLRTKEGWSYGAGGGFRADSLDERGTFRALALVAPQNATKALGAMLEEVDRMVKDGVTPTELAEAKTAYAGQFKNALASDEAVNGLLARGLFLGRTLEWSEKINARLQALTPEDIAAALKKGPFDTKAMVTVNAGDQKKAAEPAPAPAPASAPAPAPAATK